MRQTKTVKKIIERPYVEIGARVVAVRTKADLSQVALADLLEMSVTNMWRIENGAICPTLDVLEKLREKLGADPAFILFGTPSAVRPATHSQVIEKYARKRGLPASLVTALKQLPWESLGVVGIPTDDEIDRVRSVIETNKALASRPEKRT